MESEVNSLRLLISNRFEIFLVYMNNSLRVFFTSASQISLRFMLKKTFRIFKEVYRNTLRNLAAYRGLGYEGVEKVLLGFSKMLLCFSSYSPTEMSSVEKK